MQGRDEGCADFERRQLEAPVMRHRHEGLLLAQCNFHLAYAGIDVTSRQVRLGRVLRRMAAAAFPQFERTPQPRPPAGRKLRVGFLTATLRHHTVLKLFGGLMRRLPQDRFEVYAYALEAGSDAVTELLRRDLDAVRTEIGPLAVMAQSIRDDPCDRLKYEINKKQTLSFGAGMHSQVQPLYLYFATAKTPTGNVETNKNIDFTKALHGVLAYDINLFNSVRIKTELYYQYLYKIPVRSRKDYFSAINLGADFNSPNVDSLVSDGTGENYGIELTLEKFYSTGYYFLITASLFESKYVASDKVYRNTAFNGNYVLNVLGGKEFKIKEKHILALDVKATYAGGKRYVPVNLAASIAYGDEVRDGTQAYVKQYSPYFRLDVKPSYRLNTKRFTHEVSVDVQNVTRHDNVFQEIYDLNSKSIKTDYQLKFFIIPQYKLTF